MLSGVNAKPTLNPSGIAISSIIEAWNIERKVAEKTLDSIITERDTGVLNTLFKKPKRLSQTTDMPLNIVVKRAVKAIMPTAINEM